ncbi:MAG TPA: M14 family zinc carboxypeptidase [Gemmatimonadaceae bacterium]|nr:M14 family zinc carboxypeptidase [Gemmatimonadaceae bacterium]
MIHQSRHPARVATALAVVFVALVCARPVDAQSRTRVSTHDSTSASALATGLRIAERYHVAAITTRRFDHDAFWRAVAPSLKSPVFHTEQVGRSMLGRSINAVTFGEGKTTVLLWSQMHGDESTATMALADIFRFLAEAPNDPLRERLRQRLTIVFVPMLNPDGAELFQRENAAGIDINRDARRLATPEARTLKALRDRIHPAFGFNLHDQNARTTAGVHGTQAAIALEAPAYDDAGDYNDVRTRARLVAASVAQILTPEIPGRIAKYDESFNRRAFGDNMQKWGTSTILIESGGLPNDPQKQRLRAINVAAILGALDAIATGRYADADPQAYNRLPSNHSGASDLLILGGQLALPGQPPMRADVAINYRDAIARTGPYIRDVGDLQEATAIDTVDATGLFIHPAPASLTAGNGGSWLRIGAPVVFTLRKGADSPSAVVRMIGTGEVGQGQR